VLYITTTKKKIAVLLLFAASISVPGAFAQTSTECVYERNPMKTYEDEWIKVPIPNGWSFCHPEGDHGQPLSKPWTGILKQDDYRLYLITHTGHASPVEGGRFVELASVVAPWTDLEEGRCGPFLQSRTTKVTLKLSRVDLYFDSIHASKNALESCGNPEGKAVFWYGSYFVENCPRTHPEYDECGSFYISYPRVTGKPSVGNGGEGMLSFALTFATHDPDYLPSRGDKDLDGVLKEATAIVRNIQYK
jgi:hypothetical protein